MGLLDEHYEKISLGLGGLVLLGGVYLGMNSVTSTTKFVAEVNKTAKEGKVKSPVDGNRLDSALSAVTTTTTSLATKKHPDGERDLPLMQSLPLLGVKGGEKPVDPLERFADPEMEKQNRIHKEIPNKWWYDNGLEEIMDLTNATELDADKDGFSNLEEYKAKTNPKDVGSYPELLPRLGVESVIVSTFELKFNDYSSDSVIIKVRDRKKGVNIDNDPPTKIGELGPSKGKNNEKADAAPYINRFKFVEKTKFKDKNGSQDAIKLEDTKNNNKELIVPRFDPVKKVEDRIVLVYLDALGKGNDEAVSLSEGNKFSLPFGGEKKQYTLEKVEPVEGQEGRFNLLFKKDDGQTYRIQY